MFSARLIAKVAVAAVVSVVSAVSCGAARAQTDPRVTAQVGEFRVEVQCPQSGYFADGNAAKQIALQRTVRITYDKPGTGYQNAYAQQTLLYAGQVAVLNQCPVTTAVYGLVNAQSNVQDIGAAEIWGEYTDGAPPRLMLRAAPYDSFMVRWTNIVDVYANDVERANRDQAADLQAAAAAQAQTAAAQDQATAQQKAVIADALSGASEQRELDNWNNFWSRVWLLIKRAFVLVVAGAVIRFIYKRRYPIARWYYFTFYPHPAEPAIQSALSSGKLLDGKQLANTLGEVPPGNGVFRQVRVEQSAALIEAMQRATATHLRKLEAQAKEKFEVAAAQQVQAALAEAAIALEQAKAMLNASKRSARE